MAFTTFIIQGLSKKWLYIRIGKENNYDFENKIAQKTSLLQKMEKKKKRIFN